MTDGAPWTKLTNCAKTSPTGGRLLAFVKEFLANSAAERTFTPKAELSDAVATTVKQYHEAADRERGWPSALCLADGDGRRSQRVEAGA